MINPRKRREEILWCFIFLAFITMIVYIFYSDNIVKSVGISFIAFCTFVLSITTIDHIVANICISKALKKIHYENSPKIDEIFKMKESYFFSRRSWYVTTREKPIGATPNSSILSENLRRILDVQTPRLPTLTNKSISRLKFSYVNNLGAFIGRWIPILGITIIAYDVTTIAWKATHIYNSIARGDDKLWN